MPVLEKLTEHAQAIQLRKTLIIFSKDVDSKTNNEVLNKGIMCK